MAQSFLSLISSAKALEIQRCPVECDTVATASQASAADGDACGWERFRLRWCLLVSELFFIARSTRGGGAHLICRQLKASPSYHLITSAMTNKTVILPTVFRTTF